MVGTASRWGQLRESDEGISLLEVLIALFILAVALSALASAAIPSLASLSESRERELATNAASAAIEDARARDFRDIVMATGTDLTTLSSPVQNALAVTGAACAGGEPVATDGAVTPPITMSGERAGTEVHTIVTWADTSCGDLGQSVKRVTAVALWTRGERTGSVVQSTLVAPAGRGLPVPDFSITPDARTLVWTPDQLAAGYEQCAEHTLRNLGAEDRYEFAAVDANDEQIPTISTIDNTELNLASGDWRVRGFLEAPASTESRNGAVPPDPAVLDDGTTYPSLMSDAVTTNAWRPGSDRQIEPAQSATLTFCYRPTAADADPDDFRLGVFSRFDERRLETVEHSVAVQDAGTRLYLQDRDDAQAHPRGVLGQGNKPAYLPYVMGPLNDLTDDGVQNLGSQLFNWSTEVGDATTGGDLETTRSPDLPGTRLRRQVLGSGSNTEPDALRWLDWRYQFVQPTELLPNATLTIWAAPVEAIDGSVSLGELLGTPRTVTLDVTLDGLNAQEQTGANQLVWAGASTTVSYTHSAAGWQELTVPIAFDPGHAFEADHRLRLRVTCSASSSQDCNLAYDVAGDHEARLEVGLQ